MNENGEYVSFTIKRSVEGFCNITFDDIFYFRVDQLLISISKAIRHCCDQLWILCGSLMLPIGLNNVYVCLKKNLYN